MGNREVLVSSIRREILREAAKAVDGDRQDAYGNPEDNLGRIARLWAAFLNIDISTTDVASMMILLKIARETNMHRYDNWVDIAGYAACGAECMNQLVDLDDDGFA
jgi:predicted NUDIX family NTP pyrophosphohydrolase